MSKLTRNELFQHSVRAININCLISVQSVLLNLYNCPSTGPLTHWGRVTHICVGKLTIIGSDNGLSPGRRQAIIWTNAGILLIGPLGTKFSEILIKIYTFSFKRINLKVSSGKWRPSCLGLNELNTGPKSSHHGACWCAGHQRTLCWLQYYVCLFELSIFINDFEYISNNAFFIYPGSAKTASGLWRGWVKYIHIK